MRDKCLDEALYPQSSASRSRTAKTAKPAAPVPAVVSQRYVEPPAPLLSEGEAKRLEEVLGVKGSKR